MEKDNKKKASIRSSTAEYLTFVAATGDDTQNMEIRYEDENIWLTQKMLASLYDVDVRTINYHIKKIFADSELTEDAVIRNFRITADDGKTYMPLLLTMTKTPNPLNAFMQLFKIKCTMPYMVTQQQSLLWKELTAKKNIWGLPPGRMRRKEKSSVQM